MTHSIEIICLYPILAKQPICLFIQSIERVTNVGGVERGRRWFRVNFDDEPFVHEWLKENKLMYHIPKKK